MDPDTRATIANILSDHTFCVEVGIGQNTAIAETLVEEDVSLRATDIQFRETPENVEFFIDDICDPNYEIYAPADAMYSLNLPRELHQAFVDVANTVDASCYFTTLGNDQPAISVARKQIPYDILYSKNMRE
ncbi:MAG: UPF0146 family protein [Halobacteriaceae archaeon]